MGNMCHVTNTVRVTYYDPIEFVTTRVSSNRSVIKNLLVVVDERAAALLRVDANLIYC